MTAKELRSLLYDVPDNSEIVILNENAPIKGAVPVYQTFVVTVDTKNRLLITTYRNLTRWFLPLVL